LKLHIEPFRESHQSALERANSQAWLERLQQRDHTLWRSDPAGIADRLGWLDAPENYEAHLDELESFARSCSREGFRRVLLLGMGGSTLAPEVFRDIFGVSRGCPDLRLLDSTHPGAVLAAGEWAEAEQTLFISATKSGGTVETLSFTKHFYRRLVSSLGEEDAGRRFIAITDRDSGLHRLAESLGFRRIFLNDPDIGGRYSALSFFGLVPAALIGVDIRSLLSRARPAKDDPASLQLAVLLSAMARLGRDKLTFSISSSLAPFGAWAEQLVAESTGKQGIGIVPVIGEPELPAGRYNADRLFVFMSTEEEGGDRERIEVLAAAGHPVVEIELNDCLDLGAEMYRWETATALAGAGLGINPFDQPDVEAAKKLAREKVDRYRQEGDLGKTEPVLWGEGLSAYGEAEGSAPVEAWVNFLKRAGETPGSYLALQAFLQPGSEIDTGLAQLRRRIGLKWGMATTAGYGPRFLHSTGQLHKGDSGTGFFLQMTESPEIDCPIPDESGSDASSVTFGVLLSAQAMGDRGALESAGRRVLRLDFEYSAGGIKRLLRALE